MLDIIFKKTVNHNSIYIKENAETNCYAVDWHFNNKNLTKFLPAVSILAGEYEDFFGDNIGGVDGLSKNSAEVIFKYLSRVIS